MLGKKNDNQNSSNLDEELNEKKTIGIVDRGLKFNISKIEKEKNAWKFFAFTSMVSTIALAGITYIFSETTKMYVLNSSGAPVELEQLKKLPFTEARVKTFADEAISRIYGLNYRYITDQLRSAAIYIEAKTYDSIISEMERSNYIAAIKAKKEIITVTPTSEISQFKMLGPDDLIVTRSFIREKISGDVIKREAVVLKIGIKRVEPTELYPWGLVIKSINEDSSKEY